MADVFISYARSTEAQARAVADGLRGMGYGVWRDDELPAHRAYAEVIAERLHAAKAVVVLWSADATKSEWVQSEADRARAQHKLVQLTLDGTPLPMPFDRIQCADLAGWRGDPAAPGWRTVTASVAALAGGTVTAAAGSPAAPLAAVPAGRRPTLALLPFANRSGDAGDEAFGDGLVEDVIAALSLGRGLRVIARGMTEKYRRQTIDARTVGTELDTDYIMEGNLRRLGPTLRVTVQLVEVRGGAILWTQKFDLPVADVAAALDGVVADVAGQLGVQIHRIEMDRALKPGQITPFQAVQRAWAAIPKFSQEGLRQGIADARTALAMAPDYALAESTLGLVLGVLYQRNGSVDHELITEALAHIDRALRLKENHGTVLFHASLVNSYAGQWDDSLRHAERSVEVNPNMPEAHQTLGGILTRFERYDEALAALDACDRLAPRGYSAAITLNVRCWALYGVDRIEEACHAAARTLQIMPGDRTGLMLSAVCHAELGDEPRARADIVELRRVSPGVPREVFLSTIRASRQADGPRARNLATFERLWDSTPIE